MKIYKKDLKVAVSKGLKNIRFVRQQNGFIINIGNRYILFATFADY